MTPLPFAGIQILDFTWYAVGPVTTKYLADYGADVVRIESAARLGAMCIPGGGMSSAARLRTIVRSGATVLCCTPTYALRLAA